MKPSTKVMPVAAAFTALSTLACCLPLSLSAAVVGLASLSIVLEPYRGGLIGVSIMLLLVGVLQLYRFRRTCRQNSLSGIVVVVLAGIIVVSVSLFPQVNAGRQVFLPGHSVRHFTGTSVGVPLSLTKTTKNFAGLVLLAFRPTT